MNDRTVIIVTKWEVDGVMNHHTVRIAILDQLDQPQTGGSEYRKFSDGSWGKIEYGRGLQPFNDPSIIPWLNALVLGFDALKGA